MKNEQLKNNSQSPNYLICTLYGFKKLTLSENKTYVVNNKLIKSISIEKNLQSIYIELQNNITYTEHEEEIRNYLYHICFNLIIKTEVYYSIPIYSIDTIYENNKPLIIKDNLKITDKLKITSNFAPEYIYNTIVDSPTNIEENFLKYERIFKTLHNPNPIAQFMSLYQFIMELLQGERPYPSQKSVINYLENNRDKYNFLDFKQTRKQEQNFNEDCFTYLRNEIAHCEKTNNLNLYKQLGDKVTQQLIKNLIIVINDIIISS
ncbi:hypothetical protein JY742_20155 [Clostridioides difficile]|nr:hypothetical protein [Clostridioides difficile]